MKLSELVEADAASTEEEDEFGVDEGELAQDLGEALELLGDCQEMLERILRKQAKRRPLHGVDIKDITDLSQEVIAFIQQWTLPAVEPQAEGCDAPIDFTKEVDDEFPDY